MSWPTPPVILFAFSFSNNDPLVQKPSSRRKCPSRRRLRRSLRQIVTIGRSAPRPPPPVAEVMVNIARVSARGGHLAAGYSGSQERFARGGRRGIFRCGTALTTGWRVGCRASQGTVLRNPFGRQLAQTPVGFVTTGG
jgi:hypothetical protein